MILHKPIILAKNVKNYQKNEAQVFLAYLLALFLIGWPSFDDLNWLNTLNN